MKRARTVRARFAAHKLPGGFALGAITAGVIVLADILATTVNFVVSLSSSGGG